MDAQLADFDEAFYLRQYPDVAAAVRAGAFTSGRAHFDQRGRAEGRLGALTPRAMLTAASADVAAAGVDGRLFAAEWTASVSAPAAAASNPLRSFFEARKTGRGIWKWRHYFDIYDRHFRRFRGTDVHVLEIGVYSGGSLEMWREYFGPKAQLYGVDIEPACKAYERDGVKIHIGDQADRSFWRRFKADVPRLDLVIDDGGHYYDQQRATFEELFPHLRPGGVFLCEDVHGECNPFSAYAAGLANMLHTDAVVNDMENNERRLASKATPFQSAVGSVSFYPFVTVIERNAGPVDEFVGPKHGDHWEPHLR